MPVLSAEADETVRKREAEAAFLIEFFFVSQTKRVWTGFGPLRTLDGRMWEGLGAVVDIEIGAGIGTHAAPGHLLMSGVDPDIVTMANGDVGDMIDRMVAIYLQPLNSSGLYGLPVSLGRRIMKNLESSRDAGTRTIAVNHEGFYTGKRRPPAGLLSDRDQQKRHPGDKGLERIFALLFKQEAWPDYPPE
jgi:hypothetical protein